MLFMNNQSNYAGWQYLLDHDFRQHVNEEWHSLPTPVVGLQILAGIFSILFPITALALTLFLIVDAFF